MLNVAKIRKTNFSGLFKGGIKLLESKKHLQGKMRGGEIQLVLSDDKEVRIVNREYRGKDVPTDVVSLSYFEEELRQAKKSLKNASTSTGGRNAQPNSRRKVIEDAEMFPHFNTLFGAENLLGEIIISIETAARQAREHKKTLKQELQFLFVHGLLHVFGYDHEKAAERKVMFDLQDEILQTTSWRKIIG